MQVIVRQYRDFEDFLNHILYPGEFKYEFSNAGFDKWLYRGESSGKYKLIPSALRSGSEKVLNAEWGGSEIRSEGDQIRCEYYKLWQFYKIANEYGLKVKGCETMRNEYLSDTSQKFAFQNTSYKWLSNEVEELAALAQHYGVPTRMLDWTSDLFTALYFASSSALRKWKYDLDKYDSSDKMVIWALNGGFIHHVGDKIPLKLVVPPYYDNPNLCAQKGVLSHWEIEMPCRKDEDAQGYQAFPIDRRPLDVMLRECDLGFKSDHINILYRIEVEIDRSERIYSIVNNMGYNAAQLFPGYNGIVKKIEEDNIAFEYNNWLHE